MRLTIPVCPSHRGSQRRYSGHRRCGDKRLHQWHEVSFLEAGLCCAAVLPCCPARMFAGLRNQGQHVNAGHDAIFWCARQGPQGASAQGPPGFPSCSQSTLAPSLTAGTRRRPCRRLASSSMGPAPVLWVSPNRLRATCSRWVAGSCGVVGGALGAALGGCGSLGKRTSHAAAPCDRPTCAMPTG